MKILDISAGNSAIWFDKNHPDAVYVDVRPEVGPDIVADARALPQHVGTGFDLIVFDPPHKNNSGQNMALNYGVWTHAEIREIITGCAKEAHRVANPDALMALKWNDHSLKLATVLKMIAPYWEPLFGHGVTHQQRGKSATSWVMLRRRIAGVPELRLSA